MDAGVCPHQAVGLMAGQLYSSRETLKSALIQCDDCAFFDVSSLGAMRLKRDPRSY
jgi:hypothetical protein